MVRECDAREVPNEIDLSSAEKAVLRAVLDGLGNQAIADCLGVTTTAVDEHVGAIVLKFGARSRTEAAVRAMKSGIEL